MEILDIKSIGLCNAARWQRVHVGLFMNVQCTCTYVDYYIRVTLMYENVMHFLENFSVPSEISLFTGTTFCIYQVKSATAKFSVSFQCQITYACKQGRHIRDVICRDRRHCPLI